MQALCDGPGGYRGNRPVSVQAEPAQSIERWVRVLMQEQFS